MSNPTLPTTSVETATRKLRVALVFSGLPRMWRACMQSQLQLFSDVDATVDVFFHFWDTVDAAEKAAIVDAYKPKAWKFEAPRQLDAWNLRQDLRRDNINSPARMVSQYSSWKESGQLFAEAHRLQAYDWVLRLRSDLMFFQAIGQLLSPVASPFILLTRFNDFGIVNDMFAAGDPSSMVSYLNLLDHLETYKTQVHFNPERLLLHHLQQIAKTGTQLHSSNLPVLTVRPHMNGKTITECLEEHPGENKWLDDEIVQGHVTSHKIIRPEQGEAHVLAFKNQQLNNYALRKSKMAQAKIAG
ncbi:MAG: hypothetical protein ORN28_02375 [Rhodoferax sp.]|nr:hypothetical protein [Rhodoferax sp.]